MDNLECGCRRIVRLDCPDDEGAATTYWICVTCNAQFIPKRAVNYKLAHLQAELGRRMVNESGSGVWEQGAVPTSEGG